MKGRHYVATATSFAGAGAILGPLGKEIAAAISPGATRTIALASLTTGVLALALPLSLVQVYDRIVAYGSTATLVWLFGGCAFAVCLEAVIAASRSRIAAWAAARLSTACETRTVDAILGADTEELARIGPGERLERLGAGRVCAAAIAQALPVFAEAPFCVVYLAVLTLIGGPLVAVPLAGIAAELAMAALGQPRLSRARLALAASEDDREGEMTRTLESIGFVKAQALEPTLAMRFEKAQAAQADAEYAAQRLERAAGESQRFVAAATSFAMLAFGAGMVSGGRLTIGALSTVILLAARSVSSIQGIVRLVNGRASVGVAARRLVESLALAREEGPRETLPALPSAIESRLEFKGVSSRAGKPDGLEDTNLVLGAGEALGLEDDGSGWTSTFCLVASGRRLPEAGKVFLDVYPLDRWDAAGSGVLALVPPKVTLLPGSVLDNLTGFSPALVDAALDAASILGLDRPVSRLPRGFETPLDPRVELLSASIVQRLGVARAIARRPRILVWDRADDRLDDEGRSLALEILARLKGTTTLVIASGSADFLGLCAYRATKTGGRILVAKAER